MPYVPVSTLTLILSLLLSAAWSTDTLALIPMHTTYIFYFNILDYLQQPECTLLALRSSFLLFTCPNTHPTVQKLPISGSFDIINLQSFGLYLGSHWSSHGTLVYTIAFITLWLPLVSSVYPARLWITKCLVSNPQGLIICLAYDSYSANESDYKAVSIV